MTKYIVTLKIYKWQPYYNWYGGFSGGTWNDHPYENQIVFGSYESLKNRLKEWHVYNEIARSKDQKRIPTGHFRYKIFKIEAVQVMDELTQEIVDDMIHG